MDAEALRRLLISRREMINPESLGFKRRDPRGRKTPGISQEHMDKLLMRTAGTYGKLERGVLVNPSHEYLREVAKILGLTAREWKIFYAFARSEQPPEMLQLPSVAGSWKQVLDALPLMACITDVAYNVLAYNWNMAQFFPRGQMPHNTPQWMLFNEEARSETLVNWEDRWAPFLVGGLRVALSLHRENRTLVSMAELCQADPFLRGIYEEGVAPYATPAVEGMPVRHSVRGAGTLTELVSELRDTSGALLHVWLFQPEGHSWPEAEFLAPAEDRDPAGFFPSQDPTPAESCPGERGGYL